MKFCFFQFVGSAQWRQTERLVGFCLAMKREVPDRIGLLDERFTPGHYEDDDYCYRARIAGFRLMIAGEASVYHQGSKSFGSEGETGARILGRDEPEQIHCQVGV